MKKISALFVCVLLLVGAFLVFQNNQTTISGAPPYQVADNPPSQNDIYNLYEDWVRPDGPAKVALQVGHWKNDEIPEELHRLRGNTGASGGGKTEWEVNYQIAVLTEEILESNGVIVELLPATVPKKYWADVFVAIHADGNNDTGKSGFKAAAPYRDLTGNANELLKFVEQEYALSTNLEKDPNITRNMRGYYAFGWWRYDHAVHPMTTSIILETGFLTSPSDRIIIVDSPQLSASGLASGIILYLKSQNLINS